MRLLDRYVLRELLTPFAYCLGAFVIFWVSSDLFNRLSDFRDARLTFADVAEYYLVKSPEVIAIVLPVALLLALLYGLTQHARNHEITAMRAAGISLWRLAAPYLVVGFLASVGLLIINERWASDADLRAELIKARHVQPGAAKSGRYTANNLGFQGRDGRNWQIGSLNTETMVMKSPIIISPQPDHSLLRFSASQGVRSNDVWIFFNVYEFRMANSNAPPEPTLQEPILARPDFTETPEEIRSVVAFSEMKSSVKKQQRMQLSISEITDYLALHPNPPAADKNLLLTKLHSRIAGPWKCLVVVLIALPFGAASGRRNVFAGVAGSIGIVLAYFALTEISIAAGSAGYVPGWIAGWLPNISFAMIGAWLTSRAR